MTWCNSFGQMTAKLFVLSVVLMQGLLGRAYYYFRSNGSFGFNSFYGLRSLILGKLLEL